MKHQCVLFTALALAFFMVGLVGCNKSSTTSTLEAKSSPKQTLEAMCAAHKNKNVEAYKKTLSANTLQEFEEEARKDQHSLNELIEGLFNLEPCPTPLEIRGEIINGNSGVIEMRSRHTSWDKVFFVKENDEWKYELRKN